MTEPASAISHELFSVGPRCPEVLALVSSSLEAAAVEHCVLIHSRRGHELVEIDLAVGPPDIAKAGCVVNALQRANFRPLQHFQPRLGEHVIDFASQQEGGWTLLRLRVISACWRGGVLFFSADTVVKNRHRAEGGLFWTAQEGDVLIYLLARMMAADDNSQADCASARELIRKLTHEEAERILSRAFGPASAKSILAEITAPAGNASGPPLPQTLTRMPSRRFAKLRYAIVWLLSRPAARRYSAGLALVMLGPDGVGKSTLRKNIVERFQPVLPPLTVWYRPRWVQPRGPGRPLHRPHANPVRGPVASILYLLLVFVDCCFGYLAVGERHLRRPGLLIFDRYFFDLLVDPKRYRYAGPRWLVRALCSLVPPRRFLMLVLDAPPEVMFARKQELPLEELTRQRNAYSRLTYAEAVTIPTDSSMEACTARACEAMVDYLARRFQREHRYLFPSTAELTSARASR